MKCHLDEEDRVEIGAEVRAAEAVALVQEVVEVRAKAGEAAEVVLAVPHEVISVQRQEEVVARVATPIKAQEEVVELIVPAPAEHKIDQEKQVV